jgi:hypothetical protein
MTRGEEKSQETRKSKGQNKDLTDTYHKLNEFDLFNDTSASNLCNDISESSNNIDRSDEKFDGQEEIIRNISYIHRDMQMNFLKNKKEIMDG